MGFSREEYWCALLFPSPELNIDIKSCLEMEIVNIIILFALCTGSSPHTNLQVVKFQRCEHVQRKDEKRQKEEVTEKLKRVMM